MASVAIEKVSKVFRGRRDEVRAVDDLSLSAADGEFLVLVGPSGCGKSTTLRLVAGLERPNCGVIRINDRDVAKVAPKDRDVAMVFQDYALYPHMTVYKNMAFGLKMRKTPRGEIDRQVRETAELLGLTELLERRPGQLSGGEQQRVAVGRAIVRKPNVFLFDEPLSNLDAKLRLELRAQIKALHRRLQTTILYVTHDQQEAMALGDRVVVMNEGRARQIDAPQRVYDRPDDRFVAEFIGAPTMNLVRGRIVKDGDIVVFDGDFGRWGLSGEVAAALGGLEDCAVELGVRASDVSLGEGGAMSGTGQVCLVESLGDCLHVHVRAKSGATVVLRASSGVSVEVDQEVSMVVEVARVHFFAGDEVGARLC